MNTIKEIYVELLDEGTNVWRPVKARFIEDSIYEILDQAPEDEIWEFGIGTIVRCEEKILSGGTCIVAVAEID